MTHASSQLEQRLFNAYADQSQQYDRALRLMEQQQHSDEFDADRENWVLELEAILQQVASIDATITEEKVTWQQSGRRPSDALRDILDALASRIRTLAEHVDRCVAALTAKRRQLMPELDGFIRQRRMLHAYDRHRKPFNQSGNQHAPGV